MAFNPFHAFRKHSKKMFAVLAIVCMLTFVMSSGLGGRSDFLTNPPDWIPWSDRYPEAARIEGQKITTRQIQDIKTQRQIADAYMRAAMVTVHSKVTERVANRMKEMDPNTDAILTQQLGPMVQSKQVVNSYLKAGARSTYAAYNATFSRFTGNFAIPPATIARILSQQIGTLSMEIDRLQKSKRTDDAELLTAFRKVMLQDINQVAQGQEELYFGGSLRSGDDLVNFLVWRWAADKRDIQLSDKSLRNLLDEETLNELSKDDSAQIEKNLLDRFRNFKADNLMEALKDEFRVRIAEAVLLGQSNIRNTPAYVTPYEFWTYFDDVRTAIRVGMLPVKVEDYEKKVTAQPSEGELKDLFDKYKKDEPAPMKETPGFKEPKRVKLEWVSGKADTPYFRKAGIEEGKKETMNSAVRVAGISLAPAGGMLPSLGGVMSVTYRFGELPEFRLQREYEKYLSKDRDLKWTDSALFFFGVHDYSVIQPQVMAATVADVLAGRGSGGSILSPALTLQAQSVVQEIRERIRIGLAPLAAVGGGPLATLEYPAATPPSVPLAALRGELIDQVNTELTREKFAKDMNDFRDELEKRSKDVKDIKKKASKEELEKYIDEFVKSHELTKGASTKLDDQYAMVNDPGLKPLREKYFDSPLVAKSDPTGLGFGREFFMEASGPFQRSFGLFQPTWFQSSGPSPGPFGATDTAYYLAWKTEEVDAKVRTWDKARDDVEKAWRWTRARDLARQAAEQMQDKVRETKGNQAALKDFAAQSKADLLELGPMAKENLQPQLNPLQP